MANLLITNLCNRRCSFCFAKSRIQSKQGVTQISRENIRAVISLLAKSGDRQLRLLGGEPTLHPEFIEIVEEGLAADFHVHIFTNAMMPKKVADYLETKSDGQISLLCNISKQSSDSVRNKQKRDYALKRLGKDAQVGMTISAPDFEYDYLIDTIEAFNLRRQIRIGIAQPIVGRQNEYLHPSHYRQAGKAIVRMVKECERQDIIVGFDCGLTLCMFSEAELGILMKRSQGFAIRCKPIVDIGPDLDVWHCFPLSELLVSKLNHFSNRNEIVHFYAQITKPFRALGCKSECLECIYHRRGQCSGGCLAHTINALNRLPPRQISPSYNSRCHKRKKHS